jgi:outer membrane protein OmpA-like peptidoglycan-associated protein
MNLSESIIESLSIEKLQGLDSGESKEKVGKAIEASAYSIVLSFLKRASNEVGLEFIYKIAKESDFTNLKNLGITSSAEINKLADEGSGYISKIIPDKKSPLVTLVSSYSGVSNSNSSKLLSITTLSLLDKIKEQISQKGLDINGLVSLFLDQKEYVTEKAPAALISKISSGIGLGSILNLKSDLLASSASISNKEKATNDIKASGKKRSTVNDENDYDDSNKKNWLIPSIFIGLLGLLGFGAYYYYNNYYLLEKNSDNKVDSLIVLPKETLPKMDSMATDSLKIKSDTVVKVTNSAKVTLPGGETIDALPNGAAQEAFNFLSDTSKVIRKTVGLKEKYFKQNTELQANMDSDIQNLGKVLAKFKGSGVRVAVKTFSTDSTSTQKLAIQRANTIKRTLIAQGVPALRIDAVGSLLPASQSKTVPELELTIMKK